MLWKAELNRSIFIIKDQVLKRTRSNISLSWGYVVESIAIIKDKLSPGLEKNITA